MYEEWGGERAESFWHFYLMRLDNFIGLGKRNHENKEKQMKSEWWGFLSPPYVEEPIHSQKGKSIGKTNKQNFNLHPSSWFSMGIKVTCLFGEFG